MNEFPNEQNPYNPYYSTRAVVRNTIPKKNINMAVLTLVLGIFALVCCWALILNTILSIIGLILGIVCLAGKYPQQTMGTVGLVLSAVGLVIGIAFNFLYFILI